MIDTNDIGEKLVRDGEMLDERGFVKTYGFDGTIAFVMSLTQQIWRVGQKYDSFRMELHYDAKTPNARYYFFVPDDKCDADRMDKEKSVWLDSIGAKEFPEPIKYVYSFPGYNGAFNLSERYIRDTPLEELKKQYEKNSAFVMEAVKEKKITGRFLSC